MGDVKLLVGGVEQWSGSLGGSGQMGKQNSNIWNRGMHTHAHHCLPPPSPHLCASRVQQELRGPVDKALLAGRVKGAEASARLHHHHARHYYHHHQQQECLSTLGVSKERDTGVKGTHRMGK